MSFGARPSKPQRRMSALRVQPKGEVDYSGRLERWESKPTNQIVGDVRMFTHRYRN